MLKVHELSFLDWNPISFNVNSGECMGLYGCSGSGKTLLFRAIADLDPNQGIVVIKGKKREDFSGPVWRKKVGYLPAESSWWFPKVSQHFSSIEDAKLRDLGFLDTKIFDSEVSRLSSGEKQRLALVRLLSGLPEVLLLDEPTANLDDSTACLVETLIKNYCKKQGAAAIWVTHDRSQLERVSQNQIVMKNKTLVDL